MIIPQTAMIVGHGDAEDIIANYSEMNNTNCGEKLTDEDWKTINCYRWMHLIAYHRLVYHDKE